MTVSTDLVAEMLMAVGEMRTNDKVYTVSEDLKVEERRVSVITERTFTTLKGKEEKMHSLEDVNNPLVGRQQVFTDEYAALVYISKRLSYKVELFTARKEQR